MGKLISFLNGVDVSSFFDMRYSLSMVKITILTDSRSRSFFLLLVGEKKKAIGCIERLSSIQRSPL